MDGKLKAAAIVILGGLLACLCVSAQILNVIIGTAGSGAGNGFTFYVSQSTGSDSNPGTQALPFKTISKVNSLISLTSGQSVGFMSGDTWHEELIFPASIAIGAYGIGAQPTIDGADPVTGWTQSPTLQDTVGDTTNGGTTFGNSTTWQWVGGAWTPASSYTLTQTCVAMTSSGGTAFAHPVSAAIYNDNVGVPGTSLAAATATIQPTVTATPLYYCFNFSGLAVTSGTQYWVVLTTTVDAVNFASVKGHGTTGNLQKRSSNGTTWNTANANNEYVFDTYSAASGNVWQASVSTQPSVVTFNGVLGVPVSSIAGLAAATEWFWSSGVLYVYSTASPSGSTIEAGVRESGIDTNGKNNVTITGLHVLGANGYNTGGNFYLAGGDIYIHNSNSVTVTNCTLELAGNFGMKLNGVNGATISGNTIQNIGGDHGFTRGDGIDVWGYVTVPGQVQTGPSTNITITGNTFQSYFDRQGIALEFVNGATISNNTSNYAGPWSAIDVEAGGYSPGWSNANVTISGNTVKLFTPTNGDAVNPQPTTGIGAVTTASGTSTSNVTITSNSVDINNLSATNGIEVNCSAGTCSANSNTVSNQGTASLGIVVDCFSCTANSNIVTATAGHIGFFVQPNGLVTSTTATVSNNTVSGSFNSNAMAVRGSATVLTASGNTFSNGTPSNAVPSGNTKAIYVAATTSSSTVNLYFNTIVNWQYGIQVDTGTGAAVNIDNNTIIGWQFGVFASDANGDTIAFNNNIFSWLGTSSSAIAYASIGTGVTPTGNNNLYYAPNDANATWAWQGATETTFSSWKTASSMDSAGLNSNPVFVNYATGDYSLQSGSPAINTGLCIAGVTPCPTNIGAH